MSGLKFSKPRPSALSRKDRRNLDASIYRVEREAAMARDGHHCRICGSHYQLTTHHMTPRSHFGPKRVVAKHHRSNLYTCCQSCHDDLEGHVLKLIPGERGADGPVEVLKWHDGSGGYVVVREAA